MAKKIQQKQVEGLKESLNNSWSLTGNTATDPETDFIGTTDEKDLVFKTNSKKSAEISHLNGALLIGDYAFNSTDSNKSKKKAIIGGSVIIRTNENPNDDVFDIINDNENIGAGTDIFWLKLTKAQSKNVGLTTLQDASNRGMSVRAGGKMVVGQMAATPNPTDTLQVDSGKVNDSGLTLTQLTSDTPVTPASRLLGIKDGKVVIAESVTNIPSLQQVTEKGSFTTYSIQSGSKSGNSLGILSAGNVWLKNGDSNCILDTTSIILGGRGESGEDNPSFIFDAQDNIVEGKAELASAFNKWLGAFKQEQYNKFDFDWKFHPDLIVSYFKVIKNGDQVTIWGNFSISTTSETESIKLFSLPSELMPDSNSGEHSQIIPVSRLGLPIGIIYTPRQLSFVSNGTVWLSNKPAYWNVGSDNMENSFEQSVFSITLTYSM